MRSRDTTDLSYAEVGATRGTLPQEGYRHNDQRGVVGHGPEAFAAVAEALLRWDVHRATFPRITVSDPIAVPGATIVSWAGPIRVPCRVVYLVEEERSRGFAYGTLPGNPVSGEEQFTVTLDEDGDVVFRLLSFSRPIGLPALAPPLTRAAQALANRRYFASARRAKRSSRG